MDNLKTFHSVLHSFCIKPDYHYINQDSKEEIILVVRAHPVTQIYWFINSIICAVAIILLNFLLPSFFSPGQIFFINLFGLSVIFAYIFFNFLNWFFNVGIITNMRIIDVDFQIIYKEVSETLFEKVEDVTSKSGGFFASVFDYGNVYIQTAGAEINIEYLNVPKPAQIVKIVNDLVEQHLSH